MDKIAQSSSQHTFSFDSIISQSFSFKLIHSAHMEHEGREFIQIQLETDTATLSDVIGAGWFNYNPALLLHNAHFSGDIAIAITLVLSPSITVQLLKQSYELEHFLAALFKVNKDGINAVTQQENWFLVEAKQLQDTSGLVEDSSSTSSLSIGFKTSWYNILVLGSTLQVQASSSFDHTLILLELENILKEKAIQYTMDESTVYFELEGEQQKWTEIIRINEAEQTLVFYAQFPEPVPLSHVDRIALILMNENYRLSGGAFELDYEDGDLRYRSSLLAFNGLDYTQLNHVLAEHIEVMEQYIPAITKYITSTEE